MRLLLDTHLLLWALSEPKRIGREGLALIAKADVYVSAASIWEISIKSAQGKLNINPVAVLRAVEPTGFSMLSITGDHTTRVYDLGKHHNDPFDRLLVAQAQVESMTLLTNDDVLTEYGSAVHVL
jgi:PIN domain nuclease of toxin-antitoxin system